MFQQAVFWAAILFSAACLAASLVLQKWAIVALFPILGLLFLWPVEISLGLFAFMIPFDSIATIGGESGGPTLTRIVGGAAALVLLAAGFGQRRLQRPPRAALWWGLFIAWGAITVLWALDPQRAIDRLPTAASLFFLYLISVSLKMTDKEVSRVVSLAIAGAVGASVLSIHSFFSGTTGLRSTLVSGSEGADPNFLASALLLPFCLAAGEVLSERGGLRKMLMMGATGIIGLAVLLTMSRGAFLALTVMVVVYFWQAEKKWRIFVPAAIIATAIMFLPNLFFSRVTGSLADRGAGRLDIWIAGLAALKHFFLQGAGIDNFGNAYQFYAGYAPIFRGYNRASHDVYLCTAVELGLLGLVFLTMALKTQLKMPGMLPGDPLYSRLLPYKVACWGMLAAGVFVDLLWSKQFWFTWMLLAIAVRANSPARVTLQTGAMPESLLARSQRLEPTPYWRMQGLR